jgi:acyl-CoA thioesterase FadM
LSYEIATAKTTLVFVSKDTMKPMKAPDKILKAIEA